MRGDRHVCRSMYLVLALSVCLVLSGCAAVTTAIRYKDLDVQTKMSATIFLDPVPPEQRTVFVQIRNTSDKPLDLQPEIVSAIAAKGYKVVQDPRKAHYLLQANVLQVGRIDQTALERYLAMGYGGVAAGAAAGALLGGSRPVRGAVVGGVAAGAAETLAGTLVKVVTYSIITDVQISERTAGPVSQVFSSELKQGTAKTRIKQRSASTTHWKRYRTRIVSFARRVDLEFQEALPYIKQGLVNSISGLF